MSTLALLALAGAGFVGLCYADYVRQTSKWKKFDLTKWVCPHCEAIVQKDEVQTELSRRRYQKKEDIFIAAGSRHPTCPNCTKPVDGRKFLSGGYDLPWDRYLELKEKGVLP